MGQIEWAMWANESAVLSALLMLTGGIIGVAGLREFKYWEAAACSILISIFLLMLEWPRSKRKKGSTVERTFQDKLTPIISRLGVVSRNYFGRFILLLLCSIPCCFLLSTLVAGVCLQISALIYLLAAIKGEQWTPCLPKQEERDKAPERGRLPPAPYQPPPRHPDQIALGNMP